MSSSANSRAGVRPPRIGTVGVGYDGSSRSAEALAVGRALAAVHGARIRVLEVVCPPMPLHGRRVVGAALGERVDLLLRQARKRLAGLDGVEGCVVYGIAEEELAAFGGEVDLLVIGLGGRADGCRAHGAGSSAAYVERHAHCPVLVVSQPAAAIMALQPSRPTWANARTRQRRAECRFG